MEIKDNPFGFVPVRDAFGRPYNGGRNLYWVDSSDSTALFVGDPVVLDGTSNTAEVEGDGVGKYQAGELAGVTIATAGADSPVKGVVVGVVADGRDSLTYRAASTERLVWVADDPFLVFQVQADGAIAAASIGLNTNIELTHAGDTFTGRSGAEIDASEVAATANLQVRVLGLSKRLDNAINTAGNIFDVQFNLHQGLPGDVAPGV